MEKYKGEKPGSLHIKVTYQTGCLTVSLGQASLAGKRSQDPYAMVYLLPPQSSKVLFEIGNNKTKVFDRNIEPAFNSDFQFRVIHDSNTVHSECTLLIQISYEEIVQRSLSLVVAIWDSDSNSRDDYMAGFRAQFPPTQLPATSKWELIQLKHQEPDGHVRSTKVVRYQFIFVIFTACFHFIWRASSFRQWKKYWRSTWQCTLSSRSTW